MVVQEEVWILWEGMLLPREFFIQQALIKGEAQMMIMMIFQNISYVVSDKDTRHDFSILKCNGSYHNMLQCCNPKQNIADRIDDQWQVQHPL